MIIFALLSGDALETGIDIHDHLAAGRIIVKDLQEERRQLRCVDRGADTFFHSLRRRVTAPRGHGIQMFHDDLPVGQIFSEQIPPVNAELKMQENAEEIM